MTISSMIIQNDFPEEDPGSEAFLEMLGEGDTPSSRDQLEDRAVNRVTAIVVTESGCDPSKGEYELYIGSHTQPLDVYSIGGVDDVSLIKAAIEEIDFSQLSPEGPTEIVLRESGEWEDVFWHKYYLVERITKDHPYAPTWEKPEKRIECYTGVSDGTIGNHDLNIDDIHGFSLAEVLEFRRYVIRNIQYEFATHPNRVDMAEVDVVHFIAYDFDHNEVEPCWEMEIKITEVTIFDKTRNDKIDWKTMTIEEFTTLDKTKTDGVEKHG